MQRANLTALSLVLLSVWPVIPCLGIRSVEDLDTIYIRAQGNIDPSTAPIDFNNDLYEFIGDIEGSLVVEKDNIVIDGDGYDLHGQNGGRGIDLSFRKNVTCNDLTISGFSIGICMQNSSDMVILESRISGNFDGIYLRYSSNTSIGRNMLVSNERFGMWLDDSWNISIYENIVSNNAHSGIRHTWSLVAKDAANQISENTITANKFHGIWIYQSSGNIVEGNRIENNEFGVLLSGSSNNSFYNNNFINNGGQVYSYESTTNLWDHGSSIGGNYWSDFNPPDEDKNKIGDSAYVINQYDVDRYPLIYPHGFVPEADTNEDGIVNIIDAASIAKAFGSRPGHERWNPLVDMDLNEIINIIDVTIVAKDFGKR